MTDGTGQLRQAPSGDFIVGDESAADAVPGEVILIWNPTEDRWESRKLPASGSSISAHRTTITFNMTTGLRAFVLAVPGVTETVWASLNGPPATPGETVGVCGCYRSADGEVTLLALYESLDPITSLEVPVSIYWVP